MELNLLLTRQRVPMINASTLEDRTRPALDGSAASRLRYFSWPRWNSDPRGVPRWNSDPDSVPSHQVMPSYARLGRR